MTRLHRRTYRNARNSFYVDVVGPNQNVNGHLDQHFGRDKSYFRSTILIHKSPDGEDGVIVHNLMVYHPRSRAIPVVYLRDLGRWTECVAMRR